MTAPDLFADTGMVAVKVSAASARLPFHGCEPDYIRDVCKAACCRSTTAPGGCLVTIHPTEEIRVRARGADVAGGFIVPVARRCPFQATDTNLCELHGTGEKPFGCIASPFTLNANGTLIVRNRYKLLRCYDDGPRLPAFVAFRASLDLLFGLAEAARICLHLEAGGSDLRADMPAANHRMLIDNDAAKHAQGGAQ